MNSIGTLKLQERILYGKPRFYAANPLAEKFLLLMEQKSFTKADLPRLKNLGLIITILPPAASELPWANQVAESKKNASEPPKSPETDTYHNPHENSDDFSHQLPIWQAPK